jgi:hypothetical protein
MCTASKRVNKRYPLRNNIESDRIVQQKNIICCFLLNHYETCAYCQNKRTGNLKNASARGGSFNPTIFYGIICFCVLKAFLKKIKKILFFCTLN